MERIAKSSLENQVPTAVPVDTSVVPNRYLIPGLLPIQKGSIIAVIKKAHATEVSQVINVGVTIVPTVVAGQRYQLRYGNTHNTQYGYQQNMVPYNYTAPTTLISATVDRDNMYRKIAADINANPSAFATAYALFTITQTNTSAFAAGEIVTQAGTLATGIVVSGTTGTLTLGYISGTWSTASHALTGSITGAASATAATIVVGLGLRIVDSVGYFTRTAGGEFARKGANACVVGGPAGGFIPTMIEIATAAVYPYGTGDYMLANQVPHKEVTTDNLSAGIWEFPTNNAPISGHNYTTYTVIDRNPVAVDSGLSQTQQTDRRAQVIWVDEAATNFAAFDTDILALT